MTPMTVTPTEHDHRATMEPEQAGRPRRGDRAGRLGRRADGRRQSGGDRPAGRGGRRSAPHRGPGDGGHHRDRPERRAGHRHQHERRGTRRRHLDPARNRDRAGAGGQSKSGRPSGAARRSRSGLRPDRRIRWRALVRRTDSRRGAAGRDGGDRAVACPVPVDGPVHPRRHRGAGRAVAVRRLSGAACRRRPGAAPGRGDDQPGRRAGAPTTSTAGSATTAGRPSWTTWR